MPCKMCVERGQTWAGDAPTCAFEGGRLFSHNWNCATVNAIRDLVSQDDADARPLGIVHLYDDDQSYALLRVGEINTIDGDDPEEMAATFTGPLYMEWSKYSGRTELLYIMGDPPTVPTEAHCRRLLKYYAIRADNK